MKKLFYLLVATNSLLCIEPVVYNLEPSFIKEHIERWRIYGIQVFAEIRNGEQGKLAEVVATIPEDDRPYVGSLVLRDYNLYSTLAKIFAARSSADVLPRTPQKIYVLTDTETTYFRVLAFSVGKYGPFDYVDNFEWLRQFTGD